MFRQIGKRKAFFGPFQLDEVAIQLDAVVFVFLDGKSQKDGRIAGVALVHQPNVFGFVAEQGSGIRYRLRRHVRIHAAVRTLESDSFLELALYPLIFFNNYSHFALSIYYGWTAELSKQSATSVCTIDYVLLSGINIILKSLLSPIADSISRCIVHRTRN